MLGLVFANGTSYNLENYDYQYLKADKRLIKALANVAIGPIWVRLLGNSELASCFDDQIKHVLFVESANIRLFHYIDEDELDMIGQFSCLAQAIKESFNFVAGQSRPEPVETKPDSVDLAKEIMDIKRDVANLGNDKLANLDEILAKCDQIISKLC